MLNQYKRHLRNCAHASEGRSYRRCKCPCWVEGFLPDGHAIRQSLRTADWQKAAEMVRELETKQAGGDGPSPEKPPVTIVEACDKFLKDARARELKRATLEKYQLLFRRLQEFGSARGLRFVNQFRLEEIRDFRAEWPDHNLSAAKKLERLRSFFRFCEDGEWIIGNPAKKLKNPKITKVPTLPFERSEVTKILAACLDYPNAINRVRIRALVLLLRFSGLRIRDAVRLSRDRVREGKLFLYTQKTGVPVWLPLPPAVIAALDAIPASTYYFWTGNGDLKSAVGDWQRALRRVFIAAGLPTTREHRLRGVATAHPHRFRDTFAVELLLKGVKLERVAILLGHESTKVTESHYSPWVLSRQEQLEADVRSTWNAEEILSMEPGAVHGTYTGKSERPN